MSMTFQQLIEKLKYYSDNGLGSYKVFRRQYSDNVCLDTFFGKIFSWKGDDEDVTLPTGEDKYTIDSLISYLESKIGEIFINYKGVEFYATKDTRIWADDYGCQTEMYIDYFEIISDKNSVAIVVTEPAIKTSI